MQSYYKSLLLYVHLKEIWENYSISQCSTKADEAVQESSVFKETFMIFRYNLQQKKEQHEDKQEVWKEMRFGTA